MPTHQQRDTVARVSVGFSPGVYSFARHLQLSARRSFVPACLPRYLLLHAACQSFAHMPCRLAGLPRRPPIGSVCCVCSTVVLLRLHASVSIRSDCLRLRSTYSPTKSLPIWPHKPRPSACDYRSLHLRRLRFATSLMQRTFSK